MYLNIIIANFYYCSIALLNYVCCFMLLVQLDDYRLRDFAVVYICLLIVHRQWIGGILLAKTKFLTVCVRYILGRQLSSRRFFI